MDYFLTSPPSLPSVAAAVVIPILILLLSFHSYWKGKKGWEWAARPKTALSRARSDQKLQTSTTVTSNAAAAAAAAGGGDHNTTEVVALYVFPVKSCRGFQVSRTLLRMNGLDLDRRWMFVDAHTHRFLTIREIPEMTLIRTGLSSDGEFLVLSIARQGSDSDDDGYGVHDHDSGGGITVRIPSRPGDAWLAANTTLARVRIWDVETDGYLYGDTVNSPFSAFLGRDVCLAYKGPTPRVLRGNGAPGIIGRTQSTFFPDVHPVLIASAASLAELNARLGQKGVDPITVERFRANIIVQGRTPWTEDSWKLVRFSGGSSPPPSSPGPAVDIVARCARCRVPNVDPDTAVKHAAEPWDTLVSYRRVDAGIKYNPCFGMLGVPRSEGEIAVGLKLEVLEETNQHRYAKGF
jgi:uncharacterized protein